MAAVEGGLDTAYDLNRFADLSVGATLPLLARLEDAGLLRSKVGPRRSKRYSATPAGRSMLKRSWRDLLDEVPREFEAILRLAYMAAVLDSSLKSAHRFLGAAAKQRQRLAETCEREAGAILAEADRAMFGRGHRWLRAYSDGARLKAEAAVLSSIAARKDLKTVLQPHF